MIRVIQTLAIDYTKKSWSEKFLGGNFFVEKNFHINFPEERKEFFDSILA